MAGTKKYNSYALELGAMYEQIPKAVFAAIAISALTNGGDQMDKARERIAWEWQMLYSNGIVPQKPHGKAAKIFALLPDDYEMFGEGE